MLKKIYSILCNLDKARSYSETLAQVGERVLKQLEISQKVFEGTKGEGGNILGVFTKEVANKFVVTENGKEIKNAITIIADERFMEAYKSLGDNRKFVIMGSFERTDETYSKPIFKDEGEEK